MTQKKHIIRFDIRVVTHIRYTHHERVARDNLAM